VVSLFVLGFCVCVCLFMHVSLSQNMWPISSADISYEQQMPSVKIDSEDGFSSEIRNGLIKTQ